MGPHVNYDPWKYWKFERLGEDRLESSVAMIFPKMYIDFVCNFVWRHLDIDLIEENLGNSDFNILWNLL